LIGKVFLASRPHRSAADIRIIVVPNIRSFISSTPVGYWEATPVYVVEPELEGPDPE
jgi:hypothetical protein